MPDTFTPTLAMAAAAKKGLALREKFGRGGTHVGVARAEQLAARRALTPKDVKSMYSYFARHKVDKDTTSHIWGNEDNPSPGYVAWLLWGGDAGQAWVARQRKALDE